MRTFYRLLLVTLLGLLTVGTSVAQTAVDTVMTFRFRAGEDLFILKDNESELMRLYSLVDKYRDRITAGEIPVYVDGYCTSQPTAKENLRTAFVRANRVKSELITQRGLRETDFITANHATAYNGNNDMVVVKLRIPAAATEQSKPVAKEEDKPKPRTENKSEQQQVVEEKSTETMSEPLAEIMPVHSETASPYCFAVRTNLLYDVLLLPTLGVEWRINRSVGVKLDGSLAWWSSGQDKVQKMWLLNPEVRWYMGNARRFYLGASGNYGEYNIYRYMLGDIVSKDMGYQGKMWGAGLTVGYQLFFSRNFSVDFNLGLGYTRFDYDSFGMINGVRVYKKRDKTKNFWGPTQAGISLVWTIGSKK